MANREEKTRALINYVLEYAVDKGYSLKDLDWFIRKFGNVVYDLGNRAQDIPLNYQPDKSFDQVLEVLEDSAHERK